MNKGKTILTATILITGIAFLLDRIKIYIEMKELKENITEIGHCHNDFCLTQERYNRSTDEQIASIQDEIGSVYEHIGELSKGKEDGR